MSSSERRWTEPGFLAEAERWIRDRIEVVALEQSHVQPWSTVFRLVTPDGVAWFKASAPELSHEAGLVAVLSERRPDCVPPLLALDAERGWLLQADAGTRLRELIERERALERWLDVLPLYASVQRDLAGDVEQLLALGVPDLRLAGLPARFERFLDVLPSEERRNWRGRLPEIAELCGALAEHGVPETIQHDDLHDGQVYVRDGRYLLLDWGDACISHPFFTLSVTLEGVIAWGVDDVENAVDTTPYRDAYLGRFDLPDLAAAARIATRLGWICRAVNGYVPGDSADHTLRRLTMF